MFTLEMVWLRRSDTALLEIASKLRVRVESPDCGGKTMALYRSVLADLGGSPTKRSNVDAPDGDQPDMFDDPADEYLR